MVERNVKAASSIALTASNRVEKVTLFASALGAITVTFTVAVSQFEKAFRSTCYTSYNEYTTI